MPSCAFFLLHSIVYRAFIKHSVLGRRLFMCLELCTCVLGGHAPNTFYFVVNSATGETVKEFYNDRAAAERFIDDNSQ